MPLTSHTPDRPEHSPRRRSVLLGALAAVGLTGASVGVVANASTGTTAGGRQLLQFWHLLAGADGQNMNRILTAVNDTSRDAYVRQTVLAWGTPYYTKVTMAAAGGRPPDLAVSHLSRLAGLVPGGLFDPWDMQRFARYGVSEADFTAPTFQRMQVDGQVFAIGLDSHAFVRFYDRDIAAQAGVLDADGVLAPTPTLDDFVTQALALQSVTGAWGLSWGYLGDSANAWRLFWTFYTQLGATMTLQPGALVYDRDAFSQALSAMQALLTSGAVNPRAEPGVAFSEFTAGQSGAYLTGVWELSGLKEGVEALAATPIPNLFGTAVDAVWGDSHAFVLPRQEFPDERRREATYEAVALALKDSLVWADGGHTPAYLPITRGDAFQSLEPNGDYASTAGYLQYDPELPFAGSGSNWQEAFGQAVQPSLLSGRSVAESIDAFDAASRVFVRTQA